MTENPYQSPLHTDDADPAAVERNRQRVIRLRRWLPAAVVWHVCCPLVGMLLDAVRDDPTVELVQVSLGLTGTLVLFVYLVGLATKIWPAVFAIVGSLLGVFPIVGLLAVGLIAYRSRLVIQGKAGDFL